MGNNLSSLHPSRPSVGAQHCSGRCLDASFWFKGDFQTSVPCMSYSSTLSSFAFLLRIAPVFSILVNRTIDDERGDSLTGQKPLYTPEDQWHQGATCSVCLVNPSTLDTSQIFDTTWHDGTYDLGGEDFTVQANFTGTAVYVFNIIPNTVSGATTLTNLTFTLDGDFVGQFTHTPDATADVTYRAPVYTNTTLSNSEHSLIMRAGGLNASLILFDYIVYTAETTSTSSSSTSSSSATSTTAPSHSFTRVPVGAIVGAAVGGGVMLLALIIAHVFFSRRRRKRPRGPRPRSILTTGKPEPDDIDPEEMRQHVPEDDHPSTPLIGSSVAGSLSANVSAVDQPRTLSLWGAQPVDQGE